MSKTRTTDQDHQVWDKLREDTRSFDKRLNSIERHEYSLIRMINNSPNDILMSAVTVTAGTTYTTPSIRGAYNVPDNATGVFITIWFVPGATSKEIWLCSSDETPSTGSQKLVWLGAADTSRELVSSFAMVKLGKDGAFNVAVSVGSFDISAVIVGYWL